MNLSPYSRLSLGGELVLWALVFAGIVVVLAGCANPTGPSSPFAEFVVDVEGERFILRTADPETIKAATDNMRGSNAMFPIGPLRAGDGGFNAPWTWHLDPATTRFAEAAIEVCDGRPSYVEGHQAEYQTYCPWGAKVIRRR